MAIASRARRRPAMSGTQIALLAVMLAISVMTVVPFLFMASTSFTESFSMMSYPPQLIPRHPTLQNYVGLFTTFEDGIFVHWLWNSLLTTVAIVVGSLTLNTMAGYVFAKKRFVGRNVVFLLLLSTLFAPTAVKLIPAFRVVLALHLYDTYWAVIVPALASPIGIFLLRQFISSMPDELLEAARLDGANELRILWHVVAPLCRPVLAALGIFTAVSYWSDFLWPLVVLKSPAMQTLPVGLAAMKGESTVQYGPLMAASVLAVLPLLLLFIALQRHFVEGLRLGAVK